MVFANLLNPSVSIAFLIAVAANFYRVTDELNKATAHLNSTAERCDPDLLIFNRVPKVGSQTIQNLIGILRERNGFDAFTSIEDMPEHFTGETTWIPDRGSRKMTVEAIIKAKTKIGEGRPLAFVKHQNFLDFSEFGRLSPTYINFVRNPVERIISWFYYIRAPWYHLDVDEHNKTVQVSKYMSIRQLKQTMEDCFASGRQSDCVLRPDMSVHSDPGMPEYSSQMTFFCGNDPQCDVFNGSEALKRAVENVEKFFPVVGVLEELDSSLHVLEAFLPRYFSGASEIFAKEPSEKHKNKNIYKQTQSSKFRAALAANMTREVEFYHFCRQRLMKQMMSIQHAKSNL